jgi:hypothetical protein
MHGAEISAPFYLFFYLDEFVYGSDSFGAFFSRREGDLKCEIVFFFSEAEMLNH